MASQWSNFLRNLGEWHGSFTAISPSGVMLGDTPSILSLESGEEEEPGKVTMVRFRLRRFRGRERQGEPESDHRQEYRNLGRQVVFFDSGTFCKGTLQLAPGTTSGAEFGFLEADRRHRLVVLFDAGGKPDQLVLIREFRAGSQAVETPPLTTGELQGDWRGESATITADWPEPARAEIHLEMTADRLAQVQLLPDGGYVSLPAQVSHRAPFALEAGWLVSPGRLQRLVRRYDATGAWQSATLDTLVQA
jgi:hypothetical protein